MKTLALMCGVWLVWTGFGRAQDLVDRLDDALAFSTLHDSVRLHLSGLIDAEGYYFEHPAPGFINTSEHSLFNPRLTLFLDAQLGSISTSLGKPVSTADLIPAIMGRRSGWMSTRCVSRPGRMAG